MPDAVPPPDLVDGESYEKQRFSGLVAASARFESMEFESCVFEGCSFTASTFYRCAFARCRFVDCDLGLIKVPNCRFSGVQFKQSKLIGVDWTKTGSSASGRAMFSVGFEACVLDYASFFGLNLSQTTLSECSAIEVDFSEADLKGTDCRGTDFAASKFLHTNLEKANFTAARNYAIDPTANRVKGARFSLPEAVALLASLGVVIE